MKTNKYSIVLLLFLPFTMLHFGCKKDKDPEAPLMFVTPEDLHVYSEVGDVTSFEVSITSDAGMASFMVESLIDDNKSYTQTEFAETLSGQGSYSKNYEIMSPAAAAGESIVLTFIAIDVDGQKSTRLRRLWVEELPIGPIYLNETTGHILYSKNSTSADSYNLETGAPGFSSLVDSVDRDIEDNSVSDTTNDLSLSWISPAGGKFVRYNGFNYPNATDSLLIDGYNSGTKFNKVDNLAVGDVILTKLGSVPNATYLVLKLTAINDPDSTDQDYYVFNVKN